MTRNQASKTKGVNMPGTEANDNVTSKKKVPTARH